VALPPGYYCERLLPGLWGEPLNALSNLGFLWAAWHAHVRLAGRHPGQAGAIRVLALLLAAVGLASLGFHMVADGFTQVLDVAFIGLFNLAYLALFGRQVLRWGRWPTLAAAVGFLGIDQLRALLLPARALQGSVMYLPPLLVLVALAAAGWRRDRVAAVWMAAAALLFCLSLTARTLDMPLCAVWPAGLHWLWHLLNAAVLWLLLAAFARAAAVVASQAHPA
jgi:hypothetical protein